MKAHHIGIYVSNLSESKLFYEEKFGFKIESNLTIDDEEITFMTLYSLRIELIQSKNTVPTKGSIHLAWEVNNLDYWITVLADKGLTPIEGPIYLENGWRTVFYQGPSMEIIEIIML